MSNRCLVNRCLLGALLAVPAGLLGFYSLGFGQEPPSAAFPSDAELRPVLRVAQADADNQPAAGSDAAMDVPGGMALDPAALKRKTAGLGTCGNCHNKAGAEQPVLALMGTGLDDGWCLLNELATWGNMDKHFSAYSVLLSDRSKKMAEILGIMENGQSVIHRDKRCLACHSGLPLYEMDGEGGLVSENLTKDVRLNRGVSCEGCHGPSIQADLLSDTRGWKDVHYDPTWRYLDPEVKAEKFGYYDVRSPVSRTRMCVSCHIGNAKEGRVVTHEMYAAGHPPLPGFELETFCDQEPEHWRNFRDKPEDVREKFLEETAKTWRKDGYGESEAEDTRDLLIAACVNLSEYVKLNADLADESFEFPVASEKWSGDTWPEFAQFACYACHHDLQSEGWRIQRKPVGVPGRPTMYEWPVALVELAMRSAGTDPQQGKMVRTLINDVQKAAVDGNFGNRKAIIEEGRELARNLDQIAGQLEKKVFSNAEAEKVLAAIVDVAESQVWDYDSARQLVWAYRIAYEELKGTAPSVNDLYDLKGRDLDDVPGWYDNQESLDKVQTELKSFEDFLLLSLRKGRVQGVANAGPNEPNLPFLEWDAQSALAPIGEYDPKVFMEKMSKLGSIGKDLTKARGNGAKD